MFQKLNNLITKSFFSNKKTPTFWARDGIIPQLLIPLTLIYFLAKRLATKRLASKKFNCKIITVGNPIVGGAGKTPTAIALYDIIKTSFKGKKVCFLSKGYGGLLVTPTLVDLEHHSAYETGDECRILAKKAPTIISKDRLEGIKFAEKQGFDLVITDDGLHDKRFEKSLNLAVIDGGYGLGNRLILPSGPLRDRIDLALEGVENIVVIGDDVNDTINYINRRTKRKFKVIKAQILPTSKPDKDVIYLGFAGIAHPEKFFNTATEMGLFLSDKVEFADHQNYSDEDLEYLKNIAEQNKAKLITTEKDYVKLPEDFKKQVECLKVKLEFTDKNKVKELVKQAIQSQP